MGLCAQGDNRDSVPWPRGIGLVGTLNIAVWLALGYGSSVALHPLLVAQGVGFPSLIALLLGESMRREFELKASRFNHWDFAKPYMHLLSWSVVLNIATAPMLLCYGCSPALPISNAVRRRGGRDGRARCPRPAFGTAFSRCKSNLCNDPDAGCIPPGHSRGGRLDHRVRTADRPVSARRLIDYHLGPVDAAASHDSLLGETLDARYRIVREIGRGGMGVVYEAEHVQLGKRVAVKVMLEKFAQDADAIARFQREALAASRIGNAHIVDVQHIGVAEDGRPFVVMELLSGASLSEILLRTGPMEPWRAIDIMRQTLRAVGAAHAKGIIHRDLKPDNIFLVDDKDQHDFVKLLDFGISKILNIGEDIPTRLTTTGMVMGTPLYMAPEQAMGVEIDPRVDLYACGVMLYEMLAGKPPFDGATYPILIAKVLTASPPPLGDVRPGLPANLCAAVHHALQKEPEDRVATADAFIAELHHEHSISQLALAGTVGVSSSVAHAITRPPTRGRRWPYALVAGVLVAGAAIAIVAANNGGQNAPGAAVTPAQPTTPPVATSGTLEIKTIPPGGRVSIDSAESGSTPLAVTVKPGRHHLHIELADYLAVDEDEDVPAGERTSAVITLQPAPHVAVGVGSGSGSGKNPELPKPKPPGVKTVAKQPPRGFVDSFATPRQTGTGHDAGPAVTPPHVPAPPPHTDQPHGATPDGSGQGYKPNPY